jgi:hypothetical protein
MESDAAPVPPAPRNVAQPRCLGATVGPSHAPLPASSTSHAEPNCPPALPASNRGCVGTPNLAIRSWSGEETRIITNGGTSRGSTLSRLGCRRSKLQIVQCNGPTTGGAAAPPAQARGGGQLAEARHESGLHSAPRSCDERLPSLIG